MKRRTFIWALLALLLIPALSFGAAPTEVYVDPSIAADSGDGDIGTPYGDLQYALDTETRDSTNGDRFNVKAGTAEVLDATLSLTTYGTPTGTAPLIIQGYTSAAGDLGVGAIDGDGTYGCFAGSEDNVTIADLEIFNFGAAVAINLDNYCTIFRCEIHNGTGIFVILDVAGTIRDSYVYDGSGLTAIDIGQGAKCLDCYVANGAKDFDNAIYITGSDATVRGNIISIDGATNGLFVHPTLAKGHVVENNSILSSSGTGAGIDFDGTDQSGGTMANNIIEGFIGVGGDGIDFNSHTAFKFLYANNAFYNNTANETAKPVGRWLVDTDNENLGSSGFAKSGADTFANRFIYFAPLDVGDVWAGAWPVGSNRDKGAVQHVDAGGSTTVIVIDD